MRVQPIPGETSTVEEKSAAPCNHEQRLSMTMS